MRLGRGAEAKAAAARLLELEPDFRISEWKARSGRQQAPEFAAALGEAGLPE